MIIQRMIRYIRNNFLSTEYHFKNMKTLLKFIFFKIIQKKMFNLLTLYYYSQKKIVKQNGVKKKKVLHMIRNMPYMHTNFH